MTEQNESLESVISVRALPTQLRMLVRQIGFNATLKLIRARGGRQVWIPKTASADRVLAQVIGLPALEKLCEAHRGERLELPKSDKILIQARNAAIAERRAAGDSYATLARDFDLTRRWVIEICNAAEDDGRQGDLFLKACANDDSGAH